MPQLFFSFSKIYFIPLIWFIGMINMPVFSQTGDNDSDFVKRICYNHYMTELNRKYFTHNLNQAPFALEADNGIDYMIIPVVVHVIHNDSVENLSDEVIISQITVLNEDYGNYGPLNNDSRAVDTKIRFCLAKKDPDGNPTNGIVRVRSVYTDLNSGDENQTKSLSRWDPYRYFNIWIVRSIDGVSNIQGYSYLPSETKGPKFIGDGLVITFKYFGRLNVYSPSTYNRGRTTVHETGHYLDLLHTWGHDGPHKGGCDDDDGIDDTPNDSMQFFSAPPLCPHPVQCGYIRMIENYMDYSLDRCMKIFTLGQKERMRSSTLTYRSELINYSNLEKCGCNYLYDSLNSTANVRFYPNPVFGKDVTIEVFNKLPANMNLRIYDLYGRLIKDHVINNISKGTFTIDMREFTPGIYIVNGDFLSQKFRQKLIIIH